MQTERSENIYLNFSTRAFIHPNHKPFSDPLPIVSFAEVGDDFVSSAVEIPLFKWKVLPFFIVVLVLFGVGFVGMVRVVVLRG